VNSELVPMGQEPKSWEDLLDPKWRGKMAWSSGTNTGGPGLVGMALREWGEDKGMEFLRKLSQQQVASLPSSARQVLDQVIAGEYAIAPMSSVHHAMYSSDKGAPVRWRPINPAVVSLISASIASNAPHPNAAKLYYEFILSEEGQTIFRDNYYLTSNTRVPPKDPKALPNGKDYRGQFFTPEDLDSDMEKWQKIYGDLFR
jgi:iron(III) transport system substrate-binding protein